MCFCSNTSWYFRFACRYVMQGHHMHQSHQLVSIVHFSQSLFALILDLLESLFEISLTHLIMHLLLLHIKIHRHQRTAECRLWRLTTQVQLQHPSLHNSTQTDNATLYADVSCKIATSLTVLHHKTVISMQTCRAHFFVMSASQTGQAPSD